MAPAHLTAVGDSLTGGALSENGMYLGIPLVIVLVAFMIGFRRRAVLVLAGVLAACTWVFSLGAHLTVDRHVTAVRLPSAVLLHVPVLQDMLPVRASFLTALFAASVLAIGLTCSGTGSTAVTGGPTPPAGDTGGSGRSPPSGGGRRGALPGAPVGLRRGTPPTSRPSSPGDGVPRPRGRRCHLPLSGEPELQGMMDQAVAGMRSGSPGATGSCPTRPDNPRSDHRPPSARGAVACLLGRHRRTGPDARPVRGPGPADVSRQVPRVDGGLYPAGVDPARVLRALTAAIGPPTTDQGTTAGSTFRPGSGGAPASPT